MDDEVAQTVALLLPDETTRKLCLSMLLESISKAHECGSGKWGVHCLRDRVRLLVGSLIVFTISEGEVWLALDRASLDASEDARRLLESCASWRWDATGYPEYVRVPSRNGYYAPTDQHSRLWPVIRALHFALIDKAARKWEKLNCRSQRKHTPRLLHYLAGELGLHVPQPTYDDLPGGEGLFALPEEVGDDEVLFEGSKQTVTVNAYERSPRARQECIVHHGAVCCVCGFDFAEVYGEVGKGLIHVHHLKRLADIGEEYEVNPRTDLCPVCPNCHAMIHRRNPPYSVEEIRSLLAQRRSRC